MNKTLHKKLTARSYSEHAATVVFDREDMLTGMVKEMGILRKAAGDLLEPRPQAVSRLLQLAKKI